MTEIFLILAEISWLMVAVVLGGCVGIAAFLNEEEPAAATTVFVIVLAILSGIYWWNHSWSELVALVGSLGDNISYIGFYLVAGLIWSFFKWASYIRKSAIELVQVINKIKDRWVDRDPQNKTVHEKYVSELVEAVNTSCRYLTEYNLTTSALLAEDQNALTTEKILEKVNFQAGKKKSLITSWIIYWPISMCSVILQELVVGLVENIFKFSQGIYNKISELMFTNAISSVINEAKNPK